MTSSAMPSAKNSCSGSLLILANGSTAIDGLSGSAHGPPGVPGIVGDAREFGEDRVAGGVGDPAAVLADQRVDDRPAGAKCRQRAVFVGAHQPAVFGDVGGQDRRQPPLGPLRQFGIPSRFDRIITAFVSPAQAALPDNRSLHKRSTPVYSRRRTQRGEPPWPNSSMTTSICAART